MRTLRVVLSGATLASVVLVAAPQVQAAEVSSAPSAVQCIAPSTGAIGPIGDQGDTGATGPAYTNGSGGPNRIAHRVSGAPLPPCELLTGLCVVPTEGIPGVKGPTGATGEPEVGGPNGPARFPHVRGQDFCDGIPRECWYPVRGPQGPTGPVGDTGATGLSQDNGPSRRVHGLDYNGGDRVTLENCNIPATGGGSTSMLPFGLALLGVGAVAVLTGRRRRPMPLA